MEWPKVQVTSSKAHTEYKFIGGSWLPIVMSYAMIATIFVPYMIVLARGTLTPFLPFVSQVAGSPPQSGIFALLLMLSSGLAFIGLNLFHMGIRIQKKKLEDEGVRHTATLLNKISLVPGHVGIIGMLVVGAYPIDFYRSSKEWMSITIVPHLIGATSLFLGGIFYCIIITYVLSLIHPQQKQLLGIRIVLVTLITMCSALQFYTSRDAFMGEFEEGKGLKSCIIEADLIPYNLSYLISSVSEWLLILTFIVFFMTLKEEGKDFCFSMCITLREDTKSETTEQIITPKSDENQNMGARDAAPDKPDDKS